MLLCLLNGKIQRSGLLLQLAAFVFQFCKTLSYPTQTLRRWKREASKMIQIENRRQQTRGMLIEFAASCSNSTRKCTFPVEERSV